MKISLFACLAFFPLLFMGQAPVTEARVELSFKNEFTSYQVATFQEKGLLLMGKSVDLRSPTRSYRVWHYDDQLQQQQSLDFSIDKRMYLGDFSSFGDIALASFYDRKKGLYEFHLIDINTLKHRVTKGILPKKTRHRGRTYLKGRIYLMGSKRKDHFLYVMDPKTKARNVFPIMDRDGNLESLQADTISDQVFVFVNDYEGKPAGSKPNRHALLAKVFKGNKFVKTFNLSRGHEKVIASASGSMPEKDSYIFAGTYSKKKDFISEGMYIAKGNKGKMEWIQFFNFSEFENFFKYLGDSRQKRVEKRIKRKEAAGKEARFKYQMAMHNVQLIDGYYYLLGEAYYATYRSVATTSYRNGMPITNYRNVFDGYQYTHAFLVCFDLSGNLLWDQVFEMWPRYKPYSVVRFVQPAFTPGSVNLTFSSYAKIHFKSVDHAGAVVQEEDWDTIESSQEGDKIKRSYSKMDFWYDNHFLAFGQQKIKNKEEDPGEKRRWVYFLNKISFGN